MVVLGEGFDQGEDPRVADLGQRGHLLADALYHLLLDGGFQ